MWRGAQPLWSWWGLPDKNNYWDSPGSCTPKAGKQRDYRLSVHTSKAYKNLNAYRPYLIYWQLIGVQYLFPFNTFIFSSESDSLKSEPLIISYKA